MRRFEFAQAAALRDPSIDRRVGDAQQRGDLVVSEAERLQVQRLAILRLDQPQILKPSGVEDPVGDLIGDLAIVARRLTQFTGRVAGAAMSSLSGSRESARFVAKQQFRLVLLLVVQGGRLEGRSAGARFESGAAAARTFWLPWRCWNREQVVAFRVGRQGLDARRSLELAGAAVCPTSDFQRGLALLALAARSDGVTREAYDRATDSGELVITLSLWAAIHALARPTSRSTDALIAEDDGELGQQLGNQLEWQLRELGIAPRGALEEVAEATLGALAGGRALTKDELHEEQRGRARAELLPWGRGCGSHPVAPMLWRLGGVQVGMR